MRSAGAGADLTDSDLTDTDLARAILPHAKLVGARLSNADLTGADLVGADPTETKGLITADLAEAILSGVRWPEGTPVPEGWWLDGESRLRAGPDPGPTEAV